MDIVKKVLIGWNHKTKQGSKGIFGIPIAYVDACEEQGRKTLHSHMNIWIKDFNKVQEAIFSKNQTVQEAAKTELEDYFKLISEATLGDLDFTDISNNVKSLNNTLESPEDQHLRNMRHKIHCRTMQGFVGYEDLKNTPIVDKEANCETLPSCSENNE